MSMVNRKSTKTRLWQSVTRYKRYFQKKKNDSNSDPKLEDSVTHYAEAKIVTERDDNKNVLALVHAHPTENKNKMCKTSVFSRDTVIHYPKEKIVTERDENVNTLNIPAQIHVPPTENWNKRCGAAVFSRDSVIHYAEKKIVTERDDNENGKTLNVQAQIHAPPTDTRNKRVGTAVFSRDSIHPQKENVLIERNDNDYDDIQIVSPLNVQAQTHASPAESKNERCGISVFSRESDEFEDNVTESRRCETNNYDDNISADTMSSDISDFELCIETESPKEVLQLTGRRIIDINHYTQSLFNFPHKYDSCTSKYLELVKEIQIGFKSKFLYKCKMCCNEKYIYSEDPNATIDVNTSFVEGIICTGNGQSQLEEISACLNMPCISNNYFQKVQKHLFTEMEDLAYAKMIEAGKEERRLAILENDVDEDGIHYIVVVTDGAWAKRSYKGNHSSLSGTAVIIGYRTRKVLFLGVRNSYCCICHRASKLAEENKTDEKIPEHKCYKNWSGSATGMETDIICEGFQNSLQMHGLRYKALIGDGDSSVTKKLSVSRPYGIDHNIKKIECKNHLLRNFSNKLRNLGKKTHNNKGPVPVNIRKQVENSEPRFRTAIKGATEFRKKQCDKSFSEKLNLLRIDLNNVPNHVFGNHNSCASYFCKRKYTKEQNFIPNLQACAIWNDIQSIMKNLVEKADSLLMDVTNNSAEQFNAVVSKFVGGKRVSFIARGSYQARCFGAVTSYNTENLHSTLQKKVSGQDPGKYTTQYENKKSKQKIYNRKRKMEENKQAPKRRKKATASRPDQDYGLQELEEDMEEHILKDKCDEFLRSLNKTLPEIDSLQKATKDQGDCDLWITERRKRVTASMFGKISKMKPSTSATGTIKELLYVTFKGNKATKYGKENEDRAIFEFEKLKGVNVERCGLFVDPIDGYLAASPDGLIGSEGLVEVKCPYSASELTPQDAVKQGLITFCKCSESGEISLKRNHNYFFQVQGQLHVTRRDYCYFILWSPHGLMYEKILRSDTFWVREMQTQLKDFYVQCILPELIDPRIPRNLSVRERQIFKERTKKSNL